MFDAKAGVRWHRSAHNGKEKKEMAAKSLAAASIWKTLSQINVNEFTEDKGGLTYLSWSHAYRIMMEHYPEMQIKWNGTTDENGVIRDVTYYEGGTAMVSCTVAIGDVVREMWLPVMDYRMKSIAHPASRDISDAKMRCLTKCFSLYGLANYIYSGDGLPLAETTEEASAEVAPPKAKKKAKAKAKAKPEKVEVPPSNGALSQDDTAMALKEACNKAAKGGWIPDTNTQANIKAALKSRDLKAMAKLVESVNELSKAALQIHDEREEQGELING
tara:strand:+ start:355 stop:1176 length:822 start_codon:yes stop_codon:yes gene_type:complete